MTITNATDKSAAGRLIADPATRYALGQAHYTECRARHSGFCDCTAQEDIAALLVMPSNGARLVAAERRRQVEVEGWTPEHDAAHDRAELLAAARTYLNEAATQVRHPARPRDHAYTLNPVDDRGQALPSPWPWAPEWYKPSPDPVRNLVKAGALIAAEIDRLLAAPSRREAT